MKPKNPEPGVPWERVFEGTEQGPAGSHYPSYTERLRVPGGWWYRHVVVTALGHDMNSIFAPQTPDTRDPEIEPNWDLIYGVDRIRKE